MNHEITLSIWEFLAAIAPFSSISLSDEELAEIQFIREYMEMHKDFYEKNKRPIVI